MAITRPNQVWAMDITNTKPISATTRSTFTVQRTGRRQGRPRQACHMSALSLCEDWENPFFWGADMSAPSQVGFVAQTVGAALDHPDLVLEPLDEAERDLVLRP